MKPTKAQTSLNSLLDENTKKNSKLENFEKIDNPNTSKDDLMDLFDNLLSNIKNLSVKRDFFEAYYDTLNSAVGLEEEITYIQKSKKSQFQQANPQPQNEVKAKFMEKDEVLASGMNSMKRSENPAKSNNNEIIIEDSEFELSR